MEAELADDPRVQDLYGRDRAAFVAARAALAKEVAKEDKDAAREIKRLRKPSVAAWAANRVARAQPEVVADLLEAGAAVRQAQERALEGDRGQLRDRVEQRRALVRRLTDDAVDLAGDSHRDEIDATFEAASIDVEVADLLRRGLLTTAAPRPSGFDVLAGMDFPAAAEPDRSAPDDGLDSAQATAAERERLERRLGEAEETVEASRTRLERAERTLAEAERDVERARDDAKRAVEERDAVRAELADE